MSKNVQECNKHFDQKLHIYKISKHSITNTNKYVYQIMICLQSSSVINGHPITCPVLFI